jgi:hypothetical protein
LLATLRFKSRATKLTVTITPFPLRVCGCRLWRSRKDRDTPDILRERKRKKERKKEKERERGRERVREREKERDR